METWKDIEGWRGEYQVSDTGKVRSQKVFSRKGLLVKPIKLFKDSEGYQACNLKSGKKRSRKRVHQLVAKTFLGEGLGLIVNHKDENKLNNNLYNLEWVTLKENTQKSSKFLGFENAQRIRQLITDGMSRVVVAHLFGVTPGNIGFIVRNRTWKTRD